MSKGLVQVSPVARIVGRILCAAGWHKRFVTKRRWSDAPRISALDSGRLLVRMGCRRCTWRGWKEV